MIGPLAGELSDGFSPAPALGQPSELRPDRPSESGSTVRLFRPFRRAEHEGELANYLTRP